MTNACVVPANGHLLPRIFDIKYPYDKITQFRVCFNKIHKINSMIFPLLPINNPSSLYLLATSWLFFPTTNDFKLQDNSTKRDSLQMLHGANYVSNGKN